MAVSSISTAWWVPGAQSLIGVLRKGGQNGRKDRGPKGRAEEVHGKVYGGPESEWSGIT